MNFKNCKNTLKKFDGITLYSIKLEYFIDPLDVIAISLLGSDKCIFTMYNFTISYNAINGEFTQFIRCKDLSKVEFIKLILNIIREYKNDI